VDDSNDDEPILELATSIADGAVVDWQAARIRLDPRHAAVADQLRVVGEIARVLGPGTWGSLTLIEPIGEGSAGTVYRAFDADLEREVALKIMRADDAVGPEPPRAVREARLLARVRHRNVVTVFGAEHRDGQIAVSMELVTGKTLNEWVREHGPFSDREAAQIGSDLCRALAAVHAAGLLHGDIKAHNVMREQGGRIVLMDFGTGRDILDIPEHDLAGTPLYLAPEVLGGQPRSRASDIYSLGVLLFFLSTGTYPVEGHSRTEITRRHRDRLPHRRLRDVRPGLQEGFIRVVEHATADDPAGRYESAGAFEAALSAAFDHQAVPPRALWLRGALVASLLIAAAGLAYRTAGGRAAATSAPAAAGSSTASPDSDYRVDVALYRAESGVPRRLEQGARLTTGDQLYLEVETSVPAHVYIVNEDDKGESFLLYPLPGEAARGPLPAAQSHRLPGMVGDREMFWEVSSIGGREHFLIFVSPEPLSAFARLFAMLPAPTAGRTVARSLSSDAVGLLRGVGGLVPAAASTSAKLATHFPTPLPEQAETARGPWIRQLTLENSGAAGP
jgi:hypothetical protein